MNGLETPLFVVTAHDHREPSGCLVQTVMPCSVNPPRVLVCLPVNHRIAVVAECSQWLAIHVLRQGDDAVAALFGGSGERSDPFADCPWARGPGDVPIVEGLDWFAGLVRQRIDLGDHVCYVLDLVTDEQPEGVGQATRTNEPPLLRGQE